MRNKLHSGPPATLKGEVAKTNVALNTLFFYIYYLLLSSAKIPIHLEHRNTSRSTLVHS